MQEFKVFPRTFRIIFPEDSEHHSRIFWILNSSSKLEGLWGFLLWLGFFSRVNQDFATFRNIMHRDRRVILIAVEVPSPDTQQCENLRHIFAKATDFPASEFLARHIGSRTPRRLLASTEIRWGEIIEFRSGQTLVIRATPKHNVTRAPQTLDPSVCNFLINRRNLRDLFADNRGSRIIAICCVKRKRSVSFFFVCFLFHLLLSFFMREESRRLCKFQSRIRESRRRGLRRKRITRALIRGEAFFYENVKLFWRSSTRI